jgi:hypothetical protein
MTPLGFQQHHFSTTPPHQHLKASVHPQYGPSNFFTQKGSSKDWLRANTPTLLIFISIMPIIASKHIMSIIYIKHIIIIVLCCIGEPEFSVPRPG